MCRLCLEILLIGDFIFSSLKMINKKVKFFLPVLLNLLLPGAGFILSLGQKKKRTSINF